MLRLFIHQDIRYDQYDCTSGMSIKTRRTSLRKKVENELIRIINISSLKTQRVVRIMIVIEEESARA
jgi:hypothetical protein